MMEANFHPFIPNTSQWTKSIAVVNSAKLGLISLRTYKDKYLKHDFDVRD